MHTCDRCKKQFNFLSYLIRHQNNIKKCKKIEDNNYTKLVVDIRNMIETVINKDNSASVGNIDVNAKDNMQNVNVEKDEVKIKKPEKNKCIHCNFQFSSRQGLSRHKLKNRCKAFAQLSLNNISNSNVSASIDNSINTTNINTTNNNTTNYTINLIVQK
jgi:hypothetical protein